MKSEISIIKGIHPGIILERELKKRHLPKGPFAISLKEYPQTLVSITKGKRKMNIALALKIENALGLDEGYLMTLQVFHDIREMKKRQNRAHPDLSRFRKALFWDTKMDLIDWTGYKTAVVKRVFERGNEIEREEITRFYGLDTIRKIMEENDI